MSWISSNKYLSSEQKQNNASIVYQNLTARGWTMNAIAGLLGNMESESTINPGIWQSLKYGNMSGGYGLVQWTPATNYIDWAEENGYDITDGDAQLKWIDEVTVSFGQWIKTDTYNISFNEFKTSTETPEWLASAFLKNFERAGVEVENERRTQARNWYNFLSNQTAPFTPRLDDIGIKGSFYYYDKNPFYLSGYGMPNCTAYAWGRFWEISDPTGVGANTPTLPLGNAGTWVDTVDRNKYTVGTTPKLGAVICWKKPGEAGHVAIVEEIDEEGNITTSNSGYNSTFFYTKKINKSDNYEYGSYIFQGFIYNDYVGTSPEDPIKPRVKNKRKKFNFVLFNPNKRFIRS
jgi:surface antigen